MQSPQLVFSVVDFVVLVVAFAVFPHLMPFFSSTAVNAFGADLYYLGIVCPNTCRCLLSVYGFLVQTYKIFKYSRNEHGDCIRTLIFL